VSGTWTTEDSSADAAAATSHVSAVTLHNVVHCQCLPEKRDFMGWILERGDLKG
jgi:hypothetical protein